MSRLCVRGAIAILAPLIFPVIMNLWCGLPLSFGNAIVFGALGGMMTVVIVFSSFYPVFYTDKVIIYNSMIPSLMKEYQFNDVGFANVGVYGRSGPVLYVFSKKDNTMRAYHIDVTARQLASIKHEISKAITEQESESDCDAAFQSSGLSALFQSYLAKGIFIYLLCWMLLSIFVCG